MKKELNDILDELTYVRKNLLSMSQLLSMTEGEVNEIHSDTLLSIENHLERIEIDLEEYL